MTSTRLDIAANFEPPLSSEPDFGAVLAGVPFGIAIFDAEFRLGYCNAAASAILFPAGRAEFGKTFMDAFHPDDCNPFRLLATHLQLAAGGSADIEIRVRNGEDRFVWMLAGVSIQKNIRKPAPEFVLHLTDIDRQKHAENEMKNWMERWNSALVGSGLGVWDHNFSKSSFYYSDTWKALRGYRPEDHVEESLADWIETVHPDDRAHVLAAIERQNSGEEMSSHFQYRERHKDGHWIWIECRGACVARDKSGKPTRIVGTDMDISARKAAEVHLNEVSRRLALALDVTQIGVFEFDLESQKSMWDDRMLRIYGLDRDTYSAERGFWETLVHPEDRKAASRHAARNSAAGRSFKNEFRIVRPDGEIRHIRAYVTHFRDAAGSARIIGANWDVTDDIRIRKQLEHANRLTEARNGELEAAKALIEHNAQHDFLTGLPNRRYLDEMLDRKTRECRDSGLGLGILHIDLDRFKQINDTLGHEAGDAMLRHAAGILRDSASPSDFIARIGGDEFVMLIDREASEARLAQLAKSIISRLAAPVPYEGHVCRTGASIGIAFGLTTVVDARQMLLNADIALYRAKNHGRNRHEFFSTEIQNQVFVTKRISDEILNGLENCEFVPAYQLQFDAPTLGIAGVETLVRWNHPSRGMLAPGAFLKIAEDLDVVSTIDGLILEKALADLKTWNDAGITLPKISVNVSARRLEDPALIDKLKRLEFKPGMLAFELLESIFLDDCDNATTENLRKIQDLGINIEIDDFGTGHASIVSLLKIAPNTLKIDRALVSGIGEASEKRRLIGSIIEIGHSLDIKVVAEGVESIHQAKILRDLGCDLLQGFALARPMPASNIPTFIRGASWRRDFSDY